MNSARALNLIDETLHFVQNYKFSEEQKYENEIKWPAKRVRQQFIDYFVNKHKHTFIRSSPVVPEDDPTLLFTNAGMNQFKPVFLGNISHDDPLANINRVCNSQKCIRAGGKHNDLDDVGSDVYHHTFFEMLGNWSFGNYFKKEAIAMAWDLLVNVYGLDETRLYATYFGGCKEQGVECDIEAKEYWLQYLPPSHVLPFGMKENFWEMGDTGPCGPCSEIHYHILNGPYRENPSDFVNADVADVMEIWNLVFIQFNRGEGGVLQLLPHFHVDTGMGFERITSILQNTTSNYDTDIFTPVLNAIQEISGARSYTGMIGDQDVDNVDKAYRVVADHIRTLTFAISDGAQPGNNGRNYVLRRICRRAIRYGSEILGARYGFLHKLVHVVVEQMSDAFPEIIQSEKIVEVIIAQEEQIFQQTLKHGMKVFKKFTQELMNENKEESNNNNCKSKIQIPGDVAFCLYDTYGFPLDLTQLMADEIGMDVDTHSYQILMEEAQERSRKQAKKIEFVLSDDEKHVFEKVLKVGKTNDEFKYKWSNIDCKIVAIYDREQKKFIQNVKNRKEIGIFVDRTSFYAESGGQVCDIGYIEDTHDTSEPADNSFKVNDCIEFGDYIVHMGEIAFGEMVVGQTYSANVDYNHRRMVAPNHTMTHVLNQGLRKVLGSTCDQKGSLVNAEKLRFDFSTRKSMTIKDIQAVEEFCNESIAKKLAVYTTVIAYTEAKKIQALRAMFNERYPEYVRVVSIGLDIEDEVLNNPTSEQWYDYSIELCGGTHLSNTSEAGKFIFISEEALAGGVRRIEAVTGSMADLAIKQAQDLELQLDYALQNISPGCELTRLCPRLSSKLANARIGAVSKSVLNGKLKMLNTRDKQHKKLMAKNYKKSGKEFGQLLVREMRDDVLFVVRRLDVGLDSKALQECMKVFHKKCKSIPILLVSSAPNEVKSKVLVRAIVPGGKKGCGLNAEQWVNSVLTVLDGNGGGNEKTAQGQGQSLLNLKKAMQIASEFAQNNM